MTFSFRIFLLTCLVWGVSDSLFSQAILQGTVTFLNSGSRPAAGVKISAIGANHFYTTDDGMFELKFQDKHAGDKVRIIVGTTDRDGTALELVNDKVLEEVRVPSNPGEDIIEIIVCTLGQRDEAALRYNGIFLKTINESTEKHLKEINKKIDEAKFDQKTIASLQREKEKLSEERDSALVKVEELALFIATINLDKANQLVKEAVFDIDSLQDITGAIAILDNEMLFRAYQEASEKKRKAEKEIQQVIDGFYLKIKLLEPQYRFEEIAECYEKIVEIFQRRIQPG
ncbi:MAG: hypothetical protein IPJ40_09780 [Saprospirales bacterium]|nr:hypothetical protein [Saprospirales bacterium]